MFEFLGFRKNKEDEIPGNDSLELKQANDLREMIKIADRLYKLQSTKNKGLGVSCVRTVVQCLQEGDIQGAKNVCRNEHDKISNYPDIEDFLDKQGLSFKLE